MWWILIFWGVPWNWSGYSLSSFWFIVPDVIFQNMGGTDFLLRCDFEFSSLPVKLSTFHQQALLYWKLIYRHNMTPHNTPVWNNTHVLHCEKSVYLDEWKSEGIWAAAHFLDDSGNVLQHEMFCEKFQLKCSVQTFNRLIKAVPVSLRSLVKDLFWADTALQRRNWLLRQ